MTVARFISQHVCSCVSMVVITLLPERIQIVCFVLFLQDVQKHSVHTLVFRSLKRTHDMFVSDHAKQIALDDQR